jgi:indolepyruvate ferredoxin oxidoreductase beta subunit
LFAQAVLREQLPHNGKRGKMTTSIMITGVGGQGTLLASRILGNVLLNSGFDVKVSEIHGMSQRGGSVVTYVKYGEKVNSPLIDKGEADYILAFELLESVRWLGYLKTNGKLIVNTQKIAPMPVITGISSYPENILQKIIGSGADVTSVNALEKAEKAGSTKTVNVVLLGILSAMLPFGREKWIAALKECVPERLLKLNLQAFGEDD